jgi:hypothetical protein
MLDIGAALAATGEQQQEMDHDLAAVVERQLPGGADDGLGDRGTQAKAVREGPQGVEAGVRRDLLPPRLHHDPCCAGSVHLVSALLARVTASSQTSVSLAGGHFCALRTS